MGVRHGPGSYRRHIKQLEHFHNRSLCRIMNIRWQDKVTNQEVLERADATSIESLLLKAQMGWTGHVILMEENRIPKQIMYGELKEGSHKQGHPRLRYKDTLKFNLKWRTFNHASWKSLPPTGHNGDRSLPAFQGSCFLWRESATASFCRTAQTSLGGAGHDPNHKLSLRHLRAHVCFQLWTAEPHAQSSPRADTTSSSVPDGLPRRRIGFLHLFTFNLKQLILYSL